MSEKNKEKEKFKFVFPNKLAKKMGQVSMRVQMEAGMLSQALLLLGLTFMVIFMAITQPNSLIYTIAVIFNLICGWILIGSYLVTTYQQYVNYMDAAGYNPLAEKAAVKAQGNIFKRIALARKRKKMKNQLIKEKKEEKKLDFAKEAIEEVEKAKKKASPILTDALKSKEIFDRDRKESLSKIKKL